jgi:hypothetical protein
MNPAERNEPERHEAVGDDARSISRSTATSTTARVYKIGRTSEPTSAAKWDTTGGALDLNVPLRGRRAERRSARYCHVTERSRDRPVCRRCGPQHLTSAPAARSEFLSAGASPPARALHPLTQS